ncbi:hypothetical protein Drorol1_Dr00014964 [Drosera rotundifolia]
MRSSRHLVTAASPIPLAASSMLLQDIPYSAEREPSRSIEFFTAAINRSYTDHEKLPSPSSRELGYMHLYGLHYRNQPHKINNYRTLCQNCSRTNNHNVYHISCMET